MIPEIPDKLYFKIGEVSKLAGVAAHVLRYWESEFPAIRPKRANQQRLYRRVDVELILSIRTLLHEQGYTIAGARKFLETGQQPTVPLPADSAPTAPLARDMSNCLGQIKSELQQMSRMLQEAEEKSRK